MNGACELFVISLKLTVIGMAAFCFANTSEIALLVIYKEIFLSWSKTDRRLVKTMFKMARDKIPTIIFVDEVDSLCSARGDVRRYPLPVSCLQRHSPIQMI